MNTPSSSATHSSMPLSAGPTPAALDHALDAFQRLQAQNALATAALAAQHNATPVHLKALLVLATRGPLTAAALGTAVGLSSGAITPLIDRLERYGHAVRRPSESDRRSVVVTTSAAGLDVVTSIRACFAVVFTGAFGSHDLETVTGVLSALGDALEKEVATW